ncbi:MAG: serine--tRNA ligase [Planctomycetota bacterium]
MIDLKDLRQDPEKYRKGAADKQSPVDIDALLTRDEQVRGLQTRQQQLAAEKNAIGKEIGQLAGKLKNAEGEALASLESRMEALRSRPQELKSEENTLAQELSERIAQRDELWLRVPQPADLDVPVGRSAEDNVELRRWCPTAQDGLAGPMSGFDPARPFAEQRGFSPRSHVELIESLGLVDFDRGVKIAGSRSYVLTGDGMRLHQAVLRYAFDRMTQTHGFTPLSASCLVRHETLVGTGFFPHGREQVYDIANPTTSAQSGQGLALTGTGEVGLMAYHMDEILDLRELPKRYVTVSTCFRREAGSAGKDTAGLYRIHQFDKVEQVVICEADEQVSRDWHQKMIGYVESFLQSLGLPYRLLQCCTGDLGPKNADMIDLECWMPSRAEGSTASPAGEPDTSGGWGETHSASRLYDYQTRRLNLRHRDPADPKGKKTVFCHSLNNTVAASPRLLIPILELYQNEDGSVTVPTVLRPYMNGQDRIVQP